MSPKTIVRAGIIAFAANAVTGAPTASCSAPGANLLSNPGFESSSASVNPWTTSSVGSGVYKVVHPGHHSKNALSVADDISFGKGEASFGQTVSPKCPVDHFLSFDYKFSRSGSREGSMVVYALASNYGIDPYEQSNTTWTTFSDYASNMNTVDMTVDATLYPSQANVGDGERVLFDNFVLYPAGNPHVKSGATEKISNGGFESGKLGPWKVSEFSNITVISPGLNGSKYAAKVDPASQESVLEQNLTLTKGAHYLLELEYNYPKAPAANSNLLISIRATGGKTDSLTGSVSSYYSDDVAQQGQNYFQRRIVAHDAQTLLEFEFNYGMSPLSSVGPLTVDNISLREIEKPSPA